MILHTIISEQDIFYKPQQPKIRYKRVNGGMLELNGADGTVNRLFSTDPAMYLDARYFPRTKSVGK